MADQLNLAIINLKIYFFKCYKIFFDSVEKDIGLLLHVKVKYHSNNFLFVSRESTKSLHCQTSSIAQPSLFRESPLSPSEVANYLRDELKRLRKRRQIATEPTAPRSPGGPVSPGSPEPMAEQPMDQQRATSPMLAGVSSSPPRNVSGNAATAVTKKADRPVFTLKQMTMICEKMCQVCCTHKCGTCMCFILLVNCKQIFMHSMSNLINFDIVCVKRIAV